MNHAEPKQNARYSPPGQAPERLSTTNMDVIENKHSPPDRLTGREKLFAAAYARTGNRVTAYKEAGYKWHDEQAKNKYVSQYVSIILRRPKVQREVERIRNELQAKRLAREEFSVDFVRDEHLRFAAKCEEKGDMTNATRNLEALGRSVGAYTDSASKLDITVKREFTEREKLEIDKLADIRILESITTPSKPMSELPGATISPKAGQGRRCLKRGSTLLKSVSRLRARNHPRKQETPFPIPDPITPKTAPMRE